MSTLLHNEPIQPRANSAAPACHCHAGAGAPTVDESRLQNHENIHFISNTKPATDAINWIVPATNLPAIIVPKPGVARRLIPTHACAVFLSRRLFFPPKNIFIGECEAADAEGQRN